MPPDALWINAIIEQGHDQVGQSITPDRIDDKSHILHIVVQEFGERGELFGVRYTLRVFMFAISRGWAKA
jgi:hypothetical protein